MRVLDLFSGIGAYSLGLERTGGFETVAFCEITDFCRRNLRKNWPSVAIYEDVKSLTGTRLRADGIVPDWIVAGWPCQGNSPAGTGLGMDDPRSGLWTEIARLAGEVRPQGLLLENSSNLLNINDGMDFGRVLGDLAALGYDAEWHCLPAAAYDAPHIRDRVWIIATRTHPDRQGLAVRSANGRWASRAGEVVPGRAAERVAAISNPESVRFKAGRLPVGAGPQVSQSGNDDQDGPATDAPRIRRQPRRTQPARLPRRSVFDGDYSLANADSLAPVGTAIARQERLSWKSISDFRGMVHGTAEGLDGFAVTTDKVPNRVERIHALGNCNPPIIPEMIGRAILSALYSQVAA